MNVRLEGVDVIEEIQKVKCARVCWVVVLVRYQQ